MAEGTPRRVSMLDVARRAGVSGQTVSRVVNDSPRVDPQTRRRVEQAMAELGYRMNRAAQTLRTGRSRTIGVIVSTLATVGNSRMLQALVRAADERDHTVVVVTVSAGEHLAPAFDRLEAHGVDGVVILNEATALTRATAPRTSLRLVVVDSPEDPRFGAVQVDHAEGAHLATRYLLDLGHRTVAHVAGPEDSFAAQERERGWREALAARGATAPALIRGDWSSGSGYLAASGLGEVTAVFCANDQMALGLMRGLAERGHEVPRDVSVVGFDDVPDAGDYRPPLTTIAQDFDLLGQRVLDRVLEPNPPRRPGSVETLPARLVVRQSAGAPRSE